MRAQPTPLEENLWNALRNSRLGGLKFSRQIALNGFICDFVCRNLHLVVEVDRNTNEQSQDADRDYILGQLGYPVLRFTNSDVATNLDGVLTVIAGAAKGRPTKAQLSGGVTRPQAASLGREGEH